MAKLSPLSTPITPGCLIEFMHGDQPQLAWVLENSSGKCRALTINKREVKLAEARILPWIGPCMSPDASRQEKLDALNEHHAKRGKLQASIEIMEVWELAQGELPSANVDWFAGLVWDDPGPDKRAAMGRALLLAKTHFKFRPPKFDIHTEENVQLRLAQQANEKAREKVISAGNELFRELWASKAPPANLPMEKEVSELLKALLMAQIAGTGDEKSNRIWAACRKGLPEHPHLALVLARLWRIVSPHHNHLLDEAGYEFDDGVWTAPFADDIQAHLNSFDKLAQEPEETPFLSIDAATTRDIDDAFHIEKTTNGYKLAVALARPGLTWEFGSALDQAVLNRATSLYLPEGTSHMLPETLGIARYSLTQGEPRPALVADFELDEKGQTLSVAPRLAWVRIEKNITYGDAEAAIETGGDGPIPLAHALAGQLFARRLENGASFIDRPDMDVVLHETDSDVRVEISQKQGSPKSSLLVSEFMILVTSGLALWARDNDLPLLHRTQNIALPSEAQGVFSKPEEIFRVVKLLAPAILEAKPRRHAALAVDAYAPVTSPIRRYTDLINAGQIQSFLETGTPRLDEQEIKKLAPILSSRLGAAGRVQRFRPRYWKLLHLAQNKKQSFEAVVIEENGAYPSLAILALQINVRVPRKLMGDKLFIGQLFSLRLGRVDPLLNDLKVTEALEM